MTSLQARSPSTTIIFKQQIWEIAIYITQNSIIYKNWLKKRQNLTNRYWISFKPRMRDVSLPQTENLTVTAVYIRELLTVGCYRTFHWRSKFLYCFKDRQRKAWFCQPNLPCALFIFNYVIKHNLLNSFC